MPRHQPMHPERAAYFSAEHGHEPIPKGGGLGILSGDAEKSAADLQLGMVAVGLLYKKGIFHQRLDEKGRQTSSYDTPFDREVLAAYHEDVTTVPVEGRDVKISAGEYRVHSSVPGEERYFNPLLLLEPHGNTEDPNDNDLCSVLYPSDRRQKIIQEMILGYGGDRALESLGYDHVARRVLNEGHAAFVINSRYQHHGARYGDRVREHLRKLRTIVGNELMFFTHTPVPAGIDDFNFQEMQPIAALPFLREAVEYSGGCSLHMMKYPMAVSARNAAVAFLHGMVTRVQFQDYPKVDRLRHIDNGVHIPTWASSEVQHLYDKYTNGEWRRNPKTLELALLNVTPEEVIWAHTAAKKRLGKFLSDPENLGKRVRSNGPYNPDAMLVGFARRFATYKQATMILDQMERLQGLDGKIHLIFAGKAHQDDGEGKQVIYDLFQKIEYLRGRATVTFIEDYDMETAKMMVQGVDLWLNTPRKLREASGTSGMKAALNFVLQLSIQDGWWILQQPPEGYRLPKGLVEGVTGWGIGDEPTPAYISMVASLMKSGNWDGLNQLWERERIDHSAIAIAKLTETIYPKYEKDPVGWAKMGRSASAFNGPWYNSHRMILEYFKMLDLDVPQLRLL